jgi:hypothetical protein
MMLTQGESDEEQGEKREEKERLMKAKKERLLKAKRRMMMMTQRDMKVLRILSHVNPDGGQRRMSWTRILTRKRR